MHASKKGRKDPYQDPEENTKVATGSGESIFWLLFGGMQSYAKWFR